ncbi:MAG: methyltransferase MtaB domain-containing protein [Caldicoprobacter oshimai]|uniref:Methanol:corrinoid methyltransferase n=1 Tax=Caldicoprobacter faecalis TaxID=937334 RepID=A0A1I5ST37_9FIRM|nr:methyltransferase MtaB domain-containing protein [Caldicoprobacter faecalis]PZN09123.1 MAG: methanol--corrinoid methyltransferase [Caldicoprobacter oshimai]SFP73416.1 methanol:corrinoid methyltransferase [Caldicoprobacter faecalis]
MDCKPRKTFNQTAIKSLDDFVYGIAPHPVKTKNGMIIGGGTVYPEINMTLPPMKIEPSTISEVYRQYAEMIEGILKRARDLHASGIIVEVELLPDTTREPKWGIEINRILLQHMREYEAKYGLKSILRCTPNDIREMVRPSFMRQGQLLESMLITFQRCAEEGADILSVESTGGKELHDEALINCDMRKAVFALGVLGVRDMRFLWSRIVQIAETTGSIPGGDTACGFANTAMVLAEQGMIPRVFAAVDRVACVPRTLAAYEMGAVGPNKDCGYEGPYMKAIAGVPISMEGKTAACAHLSALGNIAACVCDCWSNESVQNIKLLSAPAPVVYTEQLIYDCRLMNQAAAEGHDYALKMRDWLAKSDDKFDPQAYVLRPDIVLEISKELVKEKDAFMATKKAAVLAVDVIKRGIKNGDVMVPPREQKWLDIISAQLETIPDDEEKFWYEIKKEVDLTKWRPEEYGLK